MNKVRSTTELLNLLRANREFISSVFESSHRELDMRSVSSLIDSSSLEQLEANNLVEIYENELLLGGHLVKFLEAHLVENFDEELYDYKNIFLKIEKSIELYHTSTQVGGDVSKHKRNIHGYLKRVPTNLFDSLKSMQHHVEFTYRCAATNIEKLQELKGYNEMLGEFYEALDFISRNMRLHANFFEKANDTALELQRVRIEHYILTIRDTLIKTTQTVINYIRDTERSIVFHKHLIELKELSDRKEIRSKTNMYELVFAAKREPLLSGLSVVEKRNVQIKFYPDYAYDEEFEQRYKAEQERPNIIKKKATSQEPIEDDFLEEAEILTIDYSAILYEYLDGGKQQKSFLSYLQEREPQLNAEELLSAYLETIITNSQELIFSYESEKISNYRCMTAYPLANGENSTQEPKL